MGNITGCNKKIHEIQKRRITELLTKNMIRKGSYVRAAEKKGIFTKTRLKGEWGQVTMIRPGSHKPVEVKWRGGLQRVGLHDWTRCKVDAYADQSDRRRR